ncbi:lipopolysaccharide biosynthesis protein [Adonisia turfae]|uniref:Lipopolysaccharide biosynthesis protein n=1 Tax=Adonisia turfae CCMR0081 TaxID=2292702 RepID=A0A6M0RW76_9CYAN|nr:polysaccharide biosynthesis C-terminal domain-containing protein [Adonisia turfae]NEZ59942.1 lipopolysaccharide biosynthesis protein [Adonisia turfae CCMR0081]
MSASSRIAFAVFISWLGRFTTILANLVLLPILFRLMEREELGIWIMLNGSNAFLGLLGFGIVPTLTRHIALAKGKSGADPSVSLTNESKQHIADLVVTGRTILRWLAIAVFFIAWISGYGLLSQINLEKVSIVEIMIAWTCMCAGYSLGIFISYLNCWLIGIGYVGWEQLINTVIFLLTLVANIVAVVLGGGLLELSIISMFSFIFQRTLFLLYIRRRKPSLLKLNGKWNTKYAQQMLKPAFHAWLTTLGAFLILRTDTYFIAILKGTDNIPQYHASYQLVSNLWQLAVTLGTVSSTFISQAWQAGDLKVVQKITIRNVRVGLSIMATGIAFLSVSGQEFITLWLGKDTFIGYGVFTVFCILLTLQTQRGILVIASRATENENYATVNIIAGVLNIIFTWLLIDKFGLLGVALGTLIAQLLTNSWYGVYDPIKRLRIDFKYYARKVILGWLFLFMTSFSISLIVKRFLVSQGSSEYLIVSATFFVCSFSLALFVWKIILSKIQRKSILASIKFIPGF